MSDFKLPEYLKVVIPPGDSATLVIMVEPHPYAFDTLTEDDIKKVLADNGAGDWSYNQEQTILLLREQHNIKVSRGYTVAERKDSKIEVEVAQDFFQARLTVTPPQGGKHVTKEQIIRALDQAGVNFGVIESQVESVLESGTCERVVIAEGKHPADGEDATIEELIKEAEDKGRPHERQDGSVDYHELSLFVSVNKGTALARKHPATEGIPGRGVDGSTITSKPGKDRNYSPGPGTAWSTEDPNLVIATIPGQPIFGRNGVKVVSKLELDGVNFQTGNVAFDGTVLIRGPVQPGFKVKAGGDIIISDTVDSAELHAGGSIECKAGVFGKKACKLVAKGNIKARFFSGVTVQCEGNIEVEDLITNCNVSCEGTIDLGKKGGRGQAYGGRLSSTKGITAKILGSNSEVETHVEISPSPTLISRQQELESEVHRTERNLESIEKSLAYLQRQTEFRQEARIASYMETCMLTKEKLEELKTEMNEIAERINAHMQGKIKAHHVFPGVTVQVGNRKKVINTFITDLYVGPTGN